MITPYFEKEISDLKKELELLDSKKEDREVTAPFLHHNYREGEFKS